MPRGTAIGKKRGVEQPFVFTYEPFPDKTITPQIIAVARERTRKFCATTSPNNGAMLKDDEYERTLRPESVATTAKYNHTAAPVIALDEQERELLTYTEHNGGVILTTDPIRDLDWHPQALTRKKKKLVGNGLLAEEKIVSRLGRGGTACALLLTPAGARLVGKTRTSTRGGDSGQHRYLATRIAARIKNAQLEGMVGTKSVDILVAYNAATHATLLHTISDKISLNDGDLVAIEIEASDPKKTIANNAEKNTAAGIALTLIGVLPRTIAAATKIIDDLPQPIRERVFVIDALRLLNTLEPQP